MTEFKTISCYDRKIHEGKRVRVSRFFFVYPGPVESMVGAEMALCGSNSVRSVSLF